MVKEAQLMWYVQVVKNVNDISYNLKSKIYQSFWRDLFSEIVKWRHHTNIYLNPKYEAKFEFVIIGIYLTGSSTVVQKNWWSFSDCFAAKQKTIGQKSQIYNKYSKAGILTNIWPQIL